MPYFKALMASVLLVLACQTSGKANSPRFADAKGEPGLRSASALVLDRSGNVIYGKDADSIRPIASITKLMTAMVVLDSGLDLDEKITVTKADRDLVKLAGSRLAYGASLRSSHQ